MKTVFNILKYALVSGAFFLMPNLLSAQKKSVLELLPGSQLLGYNEKTGMHRLVGTVNFTYQGNTMYCDSAHYFDKKQEVFAYGNVQIKKDDINLFCDSLYYNGKTRKAKLWGHVRIRDMEYKLSTDSLDYDARKGQGVYRHGGKVESITSNEVLTSKIGYFYPDSRSFFFSKQVVYKSDSLHMTTDTLQYIYAKQTTYFYGPTKIIRGKTTMFCEKGWYNIKTEDGTLIKNAAVYQQQQIIKGDTLLYHPKLGESIAKGHAFVSDTTQKIEFTGDYAYNTEKEHYSLLTGHTLARKIQEKDTIYMHADTLYNQLDSLNKHVYSTGYHAVKMFNTDVQAVCDSIVYDPKKGMMELFKSPVIWAKNAELKGNKLEVYLNDSLIEKVVIPENATAIMELDSGNYYNQVGGKEMIAYFHENELVRTDVHGNARTIFFPEEEQHKDSVFIKKRMGMNRLYASDLRIYLDSGEVIGITYLEKPDGVFYPMDRIMKEEQFLPDFEWKAAIRPKNWMELTQE